MSENIQAAAATDIKPEARPTLELSKQKKGELTKEYVSELRAENKERRLESENLARNLQETATKLKETEENSKRALEEVKNLQVQAEQKMIRADIKVFANKYNLRDLDDVKLADLSGIKINENGDVSGVEEAIIALKAKKPYLFEEVSTSRAINNPSPVDAKLYNPQEVMKMSPLEYEAYESSFLSNIGNTLY